MKASLNWMNQLTDGQMPLDAPDVIERIGSQIGAVEDVQNPGGMYRGAVVAQVVASRPLSGSDHLSVCLIDDKRTVKDVERDRDGFVQVVCGAPNVAKDLYVVWLPPGTVVPATAAKDPLTLESRQIMGTISNGMLASARELALGSDHSGIVALPEDARPGTYFSDYLQLDDRIVDIENKMFAHRPDLFGELGLARELSGVYGRKFNSPDWYRADIGLPEADNSVKLEIKNLIPDQCPRFMAVVMDGFSNGVSPLWLSSWLTRVGIRPVSLIVDITNYVMMVTAQPLHAYDLSKLGNGKEAEIQIRKPAKAESLQLLNGKQMKLLPDDIVIADWQRAIGLAGVMGGADTEVDGQTTAILLEAASFDMYSIRRTSMAHGIFSDAVTRYTKGQSPWQCQPAVALVWQLVQKLQPNVRVRALADIHTDLPVPGKITLGLNMAAEYLGMDLPEEQLLGILSCVELSPVIQDGQLTVTPPFWRTDLSGPEDIIEEIARLYGIDRLPQLLPRRNVRPASQPELLTAKTMVRRILSAGGANELYTYSFIDRRLLESTGVNPDNAFKLSNALNPGLQYYRTSVTPSLLEHVHPNLKAGYERFCLFEFGKAHMIGHDDADGLPLEDERLAMVFAANDKVAKDYAGEAYYQIRYYLEYMLSRLGLDVRQAEYLPLASSGLDAIWNLAAGCFAPPRSAVVSYKGSRIGILGEFQPSVSRALKLPFFCAGAELDSEALARLLVDNPPAYLSLSQYPKITQDLTVVRPAGETYAELVGKLKTVLQKLLPDQTDYDLSLKDLYQSEQAPDKHWTFRLRLMPRVRTLTGQEAATLIDRLAREIS